MTHSFGLSTTARLALLQRLAKRRAHQDEARIGQGEDQGRNRGSAARGTRSRFADLPELGPSGLVRGQLISQADRSQAIAALQEAMREGRIDVDDYVSRKAHVEKATDRGQLNQAFAGLGG